MLGRLREFWRRGWVGKLVIVGVAGGVSLTVLLVLCCAAILLVRSPAQPVQPTVVALPAATAAETSAPTTRPTEFDEPTEAPAPTAEPTETPRPTNTPAPTLRPRNTPAPAATAAAGIPAAVRVYMTAMGTEIGKIGDALGALGALLQEPKLTDTDWQIDLAVQIVTIQQGHQALTAMDVPEEMTEIHQAVLDATGDCDTSMRLLTSGIDDRNTQDIQQAVTFMGQCGEKIVAANRQVEAYKSAHE